jgi:hypothetical protein
MDLGEWLKGLGLGQYEATFREHEIDADVLPDLTEADLEKIGLPLGARKRLMKGIAGLASKEAPPVRGNPHPAAGTFSHGPASSDGLGRAAPDHGDVPHVILLGGEGMVHTLLAHFPLPSTNSTNSAVAGPPSGVNSVNPCFWVTG